MCILGGKTQHFFSIEQFFMKIFKLKKKVEYSFDAELLYLSIAEVFRSIKAAQTALHQIKKLFNKKYTKSMKIG